MAQNPSPPAVATALVNITDLVTDYGGVTAYEDGSGAEASAVAGILQAEDDIVDLEAAVGTDDEAGDLFTRVAAAEASIGTDDEAGDLFTRVAAAETSIGTDDEAGDLFTRVAANEALTQAYNSGNLLPGMRLNSGAAVPAYSDGTDGWTLDDSEVFGLRINDDSTTVFATSITIPDDVDDSTDIVLHARGYRTGTNDTGAILTFGAFEHDDGDAHTADDDAGGDTDAFAVAGADTFDEVTKTFAAGTLPAGSNVTLTMVIKNTTLADDDLIVTDVWLVGARA